MHRSPMSDEPRVSTRTVAEVGLMLALFAVLDFLAVRLPINVAGGSISLAMVPVMLYAVVRGPGLGVATGALAGGLDLLLQPLAVHPVQVALDYPVAYAVVGLGAGLFAGAIRRSYSDGANAAGVAFTLSAGVLAGVLRFLAHFASGIVFFGSYAPEGQAVWLYSLVYNLSYVGPSTLISTAIVAVAVRPVLRALNVNFSGSGER